MASTIKASQVGLELVDRERRKKGWKKTEVKWQLAAAVSKSSLERFWMQKPIKQQNFEAICVAVGVADWQQVADLPPIAPVSLPRSSNLAQTHEPVLVELESFAQQIFDWFGALTFEFEGLPRRTGNYAEWVIRLPVRRSRFDRVLIRAIIHEAGLSDLDGLRRSVADLRVDEGWLVTSLWVSPAVKQVLIKSEERLICQTFDELIDQDANFTPYVAWLEAEVRRRELEKYYVPLGCTKGEFDGSTKTLRGVSSYPVSEGGIDLYIDRWLENPMNEHVSILGEFGTGKTWFVLHYAGRCLQAYLEAKRKGLPRPRLPLVIPLRDYAKALNVENVLAGFFYTQHNIRLNSAVFDRLNQMGKLLLIFDGFDEMADKVDHQKMIDNFWELAKVVTTNAKVILTCRTEHFPTAQVGRDTLRGELLASTARLTGVPPQFETLELMKFDDEQIKEVLGRRTNEVTVSKVMGNGQVLDLLRRAVMAEFVLAALPEIEAGVEIDLARVYLYAVRRQMEENITTGRTFTSLADKLYFLCELSWEMLSTDRMSLNYREFPDLLKKFFGCEVESQKDLDHWHYDMMGQTMLVRNDDGDYSPAHRSLLEFFVAYKFAAELGLLAPDFLEIARKRSRLDEKLEHHSYTWSTYFSSDDLGKQIATLKNFETEPMEGLRSTFGRRPLSQAIMNLLKPLLNVQVEYRQENLLLELIQKTNADEASYLAGNLVTILVVLNSHALEYQNLSNVNLAYANLLNAGLIKTNLSGSNLENCVITKAFAPVTAIVVSKNQKFITAHNDNTIVVWDMEGSKELYRLTGHSQKINCLAISHDGKYLYSSSDDHKIKEWGLEDGSCQKTFDTGECFVQAIVLSRYGGLLYSGDTNGSVKEWRIVDQVCQRIFKDKHQHTISTMAIKKDNSLLYSGGEDGVIKEWDVIRGSCQRRFDRHRGWVHAITLNAQENSLYSSGDDGMIIKWEIASDIDYRVIGSDQGFVRAIALSGNEDFIYSSGGDCTIKKWNLSNSTCKDFASEITFENGHKGSVRAISLSEDNQLLYSGGADCKIKQWEVSSGVCLHTVESHEYSINAIVLGEDEKFIYSGGNNFIREWNLTNDSCQRIFKGHDGWIKVMITGGITKTLYSGGDDNVIKKWDLDSGELREEFKGHKGSINGLALSTDDNFLYSGSSDTVIREWKIFDKTYRDFEGHSLSVSAIILSKNGDFMYSASQDKTIKKWAIGNKECQYTFNNEQSLINEILLSPKEEWLYSAGNFAIKKIDLLKESNDFIVVERYENWVNTIAVSNDGEILYFGSDIVIKKITLTETDIPCQTVSKNHAGWINKILLSKDGRILYSSGSDGLIKKFDLETKKCQMIDTRLCAGANITGAKGLTPAQTDSLIALGAFDDNRKFEHIN